MNDAEYMKLALELAWRGCGHVSPNPLVGAVIVRDGEIIGRGWHAQYGGLHAERNALADCKVSPAGATMYVTLEPCCHRGKQPPCVEAILQAGIRRVVVGSGDPNPLVAGRGIRLLREQGVTVVEHVLEEECDRLNQVFFHYIRTKRPYVVLKYAMTMDGKIAAYTGASKWITGETARNHVHQLRNRYTAIMAGVGTVLADDPQLTCRCEGGRDPIRIICDSHLRTPLTACVVRTARETSTIIATCTADPDRKAPYEAAGCQVLTVPERNGRVDLDKLMDLLGQQEIDSILVEGGGTLHWSALESGIACKVMAYVAPKLLGGSTARTPVEGQGFPTPDDGVQLRDLTVTRLGADILLESEVEPRVHRDR